MNPSRPRRGPGLVAIVAAAALVVAAFIVDLRDSGSRRHASSTAAISGPSSAGREAGAAPVASPASQSPTGTEPSGTERSDLLPGMPQPLDPSDLYAADRPGMLSPVVRGDLPRIYVPNNLSNTVSVIDPATYRILETVRVPVSPELVVPSWDLRTLWVNSDRGNALTPINPVTGAFGKPVPVDDPYNLYFTPNGASAVVMAEARREIVFRDPHSMKVQSVVHV
ncbi:MAG TPA: YncE family protein, partial [Micromonosporaceae bacterium]|nr:YncE family protein [Micromonosporaceae bacterium]